MNDLPCCCNFNFMCPVSPLDSDELLCQPCDEEDEGFERVSDASILAHVDKDEKVPDSDIMEVDDRTPWLQSHWTNAKNNKDVKQ